MAPSLPLLFILLSISTLSLQQDILPLNPSEQESLYQTLESINSTVPWRTLFPDDLCLFPPHGIVCDFFSDSPTVLSPHVTELNFGPVSDFSPNPRCSRNATFPISLSSFPRLRKLFFYRCFTDNPVAFPVFSSGFGSDLQELVFIDNPALVGTLGGDIGNLASLRRFILTGSRVSGPLPAEISQLASLEQLSLSGDNLSGEIAYSIGSLTSLRLLDLSDNGFEGEIPSSMGHLRNLLKLDLSSNGFVGKIPESLKELKNLEHLDLSKNRLGGYGVPLFVGEMSSLKELYLSGNQLGGAIPEIWKNLEGIIGIGLSSLGLVGNIPSSMGVYLRNAVYIGLDNNSLEGSVPMEFGMLERVHELSLENNRLSGRVPLPESFIARLGGKLKLQGNTHLCIDKQVFLKGTCSSNTPPCNTTFVSSTVPLSASASSPSFFNLFMTCFLLQLLLGLVT